MPSRLVELFTDPLLAERIGRRLPRLFQLAEVESSRAGRVGMEVGSLRERIVVALLMYKFGKADVDTEVPITKPEIDVMVFGVPVSIKTITGRGLSGVKLAWTVDSAKASEFRNRYYPGSEMLLVQIVWGGTGSFWYIPLEVQERVFERLGREAYIKLPKPGTNPRGVEISRLALETLVSEGGVMRLQIEWKREKVAYDPYKRWVDYWREEWDE